MSATIAVETPIVGVSTVKNPFDLDVQIITDVPLATRSPHVATAPTTAAIPVAPPRASQAACEIRCSAVKQGRKKLPAPAFPCLDGPEEWMHAPDRKPLYRHIDVALLRAAAAPLTHALDQWPDLTDTEACRVWLDQMWSRPDLASSVAGPGCDRRFCG